MATTSLIVDQLQSSLVELLDFGWSTKQAHWNVVGPLFRPVHLELDDIAETAYDGADQVAERLAALLQVPDGRAVTVVADSPFETFPLGKIQDREAVRLIEDRITMLNERLHTRFESMGSDMVSQNILIGIAEDLEKHRWMLRVQLGL